MYSVGMQSTVKMAMIYWLIIKTMGWQHLMKRAKCDDMKESVTATGMVSYDWQKRGRGDE